MWVDVPVPRAILGALAAAGLATAAAWVPAAHAQGLALRPCPDEPDLRCGVLAVPLDPAAPAGPSLGLRVRMVPPRGPARRTVVLLAGGPGEAAISPGAGFERSVAALAPGLRVVTVDQRGTGATALRCPAVESAGDDDPAAAVLARCAEEIGPARALYTTRESVADLDLLRRALGVPRWTLLGVSYGSLVATAYARTHPAATERLVLDSVVGPDGNEAVDLDAYAAGRRVVRDLCGGGRCRPVTADLVRDVTRLEAVLRVRGVPGVRVDPGGRARRAVFGGPSSPGELFQVLGAGDVNPQARAAFPGAVRAALAGDASALLRLERADDLDLSPARFSIALLAATSCAESRLPWSPADTPEGRALALRDAVRAAPSGAFRPFQPPGPDSGIGSLCLGWPGAPSTTVPDAPLPDVPALMLVGGHDVRTPLESARRLAMGLPGARVVTVRGAGHSLLASGTPCVERAVSRFLRGLGPGACPGVDMRPVPEPVPPGRLAAVPPAGLPGRAGRTLAALRLTARDAAGGVFYGRASESGAVIRYEGLRGGSAVFARSTAGVTLRRYEYVPGVRVTGRLGVDDAGLRLVARVTGPAAARGRVVLAGGRARGTLGGRRVDVPFRLGVG